MTNPSPEKNSYNWVVDQERETQELTPTEIEFEEDGVHVKLERIPFGKYAAVHIGYVDTQAPYVMAPTHTAPAGGEKTLSFVIAASGRAIGKLPEREEFLLDAQWGILTDFTEGSTEFTIDPKEAILVFGGTLSMTQVMTLFRDESLLEGLEGLLPSTNMVRSFSTTSSMRALVQEAISTPLAGALRRLYLEGIVLQLFALIFQSRLSEAITEPSDLDFQAIKAAAKMLEQDLAHPPKLIQLSEMTGLSARKISQGFKDLYGKTLVEYLLEKRMISTHDLIHAEPDTPLKTLAMKAGYNHVSNFTRAFKGHFGITPAAFVKEQARKPS